MKFVLGALCALTLCAAPIGGAAAATVVVERTVTLSGSDYEPCCIVGFPPASGPHSRLFVNGPNAISAVSLAEGDTLDLTINFTSPVTLESPVFFFPYLGASGPSQATTTAVSAYLSFLEMTGPATQTSSLVTVANCCAFVGAQFYAEDYLTGPGPITLSGIRLLMTIDDYADPAVLSRDYSSVWFAYTSAVPEPGTWALFITGFGLAGAAIRRAGTSRRQALAA